MERKSSLDSPMMVERHIYMGHDQWTVNYSVEYNGYVYDYESVTLEPGVWDYSPIVSAVIREWYSDDRMQAIVNNYLLGEGAEDFAKMQKDRIRAKIIACEALLYAHDEGLVEPEGFIREAWEEKLEQLRDSL